MSEQNPPQTTDEGTPLPVTGGLPTQGDVAPATIDGVEPLPPLARPEKGIMGQTTPDVATGSTPLTRHDD